MIPFKNLLQIAKSGAIAEQRYHRRKSASIFPKWARLKDLSDRKKTVGKDKAVVWDIGGEEGAVADHMEMSGFLASVILSYGKTKKDTLSLLRHVSFPALRVKPNLTFSHFRFNFKSGISIFLEDTELKNEKPLTVKLRGTVTIESDFMSGARVVRTFSVSPAAPALIEKIEVTNLTNAPVLFTASENRKKNFYVKDPRLLCGPLEVCSRLVDANGDFRSDKRITAERKLVPNATAVCYVVHYAIPKGETLNFNAEREIKERQKLTDSLFKSMQLTSGDSTVDAFFAQCALRGSESIFINEKGLLHSPGGGGFYAAVWANDQCEYANPFFPFLNYAPGVEQALNVYRLYAEYVLRGECAPQSIVAGGTKPFITAGDRGDTEMYLYGLTRFLLAYGDAAVAESFWESILAALQFIRAKKSADGVIFSDSDELENRFPSGSYNLTTNCLYYDGLLHTAKLADALGKDGAAYLSEAETLKASILAYFRGTVEGVDTYRYYAGNSTLRSWICLPAIVGIRDAASATYDALFGKKMYANGTMRTASDSATVWDRTLLYALRGAFMIAHPNAFKELQGYAIARMTGAHSPYPYEAYPEGNRAHLAAESILLLRAVTEGMFGFDPVSFEELQICPAHPARLTGIYYFGTTFEVDATDGVSVKIGSKTYPANGGTVFNFRTLSWR